MPQDRWNAYIAYRLTCVRERIQETERLMRPPTPEELLRLQWVLQRLHEQAAQLTSLLARTPPRGDVIPPPEAVSSSSATVQRRFFS